MEKSIADGVISTDENGKIDIMNPTAELLTGYSQEESEGLYYYDVFQLFDEINNEPCYRDFYELVHNEDLQTYIFLKNKNGKMTPIEFTTSPIRTDGHYSGVVIGFRDYTEKRERERLHSQGVMQHCMLIGEILSLDYDTMKDLETASLLHDIGKIAINLDLLDKKTPLIESELVEIRKHLESSYRILKSVDQYSALSEYVLSHLLDHIVKKVHLKQRLTKFITTQVHNSPRI